MNVTRREFAVLGGASLAVSTLDRSLAAQIATLPKAAAIKFPANAWHQRLKRIVQVNFNEHDPENFDVEAWEDYLASCKAQATFLSITNIVAFYPSTLPDYPRSSQSGDDLFWESWGRLQRRRS